MKPKKTKRKGGTTCPSLGETGDVTNEVSARAKEGGCHGSSNSGGIWSEEVRSKMKT